MNRARRNQRTRNGNRTNPRRRRNRFQLPGPSSASRVLTGTRDMTIQTRSITSITSIRLSTSTSDFYFGLADAQFLPNGASTGEFFQKMADVYEQYRITRIQSRVSPGLGMTFDDRGRTILFSRVDPDYNNTAQSLSNLRSLVASANCKSYNFSAGGNKLILDYQPIMRPGSGNSDPWQMLPARLQWYDTSDINDATSPHKWRGGTIGFTLPNDSTTTIPIKHLTVVSRIEVAFRGRKCTYDAISLPGETFATPMNQHQEPSSKELENSDEEFEETSATAPEIRTVSPVENSASLLSKLCLG